MKRFLSLLVILISAACSTEKEEEEWYYAIYVRDTCETTQNTIYSEYYCVSKETYNRAVELFEQDDCAEINFKSLDGETIQGVVSGTQEAVYEISCQ